MLSSGNTTVLSTNITTTTALCGELSPNLPQNDSTAATLCGELIVIGGGDEESSLDCIH